VPRNLVSQKTMTPVLSYGENREVVRSLASSQYQCETDGRCASLSTTFALSQTYLSAITDHAVEENHVIDWDKAKVVDREA